jgi:hypothetical protein
MSEIKKNGFSQQNCWIDSNGFFFLTWGIYRTLNKVNMCFGVCIVVWVVLDMMSPLLSPTCNWSLPR